MKIDFRQDIIKSLEFGTRVLQAVKNYNSNFVNVFSNDEIMREAVCNMESPQVQRSNIGVSDLSFSEHMK